MWGMLLSIFGLFALYTAIVFTIVSRFTIYRHTCKILREHRPDSSYKCGILGFVGTLSLVLVFTFPDHIEDPIFNGDLKVSHYATRSEKIIAYITMYSWLLFMLCIVSYYVVVMLGFMGW
jgi:hypothetical protein